MVKITNRFSRPFLGGHDDVIMSSRNLLTFHSRENCCILKHLKCHGRFKWYLQGNRKGLNLFSNTDQQFYSGL